MIQGTSLNYRIRGTLAVSRHLQALRSFHSRGAPPRRGQERRLALATAPDTQLPPTEPLDELELLRVIGEVKSGDFTARMPAHWTGVAGKVADGLNEIISSNQALGTELQRVSRVVGKEGKLSQRVTFKGTDEVWGDCVDSVNSLIEDLVRPSTEMQRVIGAVADGDLSKKVSVDVHGEMLELKNTINGMVDQLVGFISEVTRVAREVGTEGKLGQAAAYTIEVGGVWKELTDNVNLMAGNLTGQVRDIAEVTTAVANGDLSKKITADVRGEFLELKNTVNAMVDQLNRFAGEVSRVAREVGIEGKLGGQAQSQEVAGVWKDLTDDVNQLAANLTNQVRAITEVATAVTEGDLTRQVRVEASGEVAVLKDKLNEMIRNLDETMRENTEQDWLKTNLARFTNMLQGQRDLETVSNMILAELAPLISARHGVFYALTEPGNCEVPLLEFQASYGYKERKQLSKTFRLGEGLVGQCAVEKERILLTDVPSDYVRINSGLGEAAPLNIVVLPILFEGSIRAVIELASFAAFSSIHQALLDQLAEVIGLVLNTVESTSVTEMLLAQARSQAKELQSRQEQLRHSNEDLADQAELLAEKNNEVESKFQEIEAAKRLVEEKAAELSTSSKYKTEFIANMSHELRTPLNSVLVLAEQLQENPDGNLSDRQVEYARVIHSSGEDLLKLLTDILDLAKVESNTVTIDASEVSLSDFGEGMLRSFEPIAKERGTSLSVELGSSLPETITTDPRRLGQVVKNLLANACKFTESGTVKMVIDVAENGWTPSNTQLAEAESVISISIIDSGIGIASADQEIVFEPFAQVDGTTARSYGGTGLGLSISRDLVKLLHGEISLQSELGAGSVFTVYLPARLKNRAEPAAPLLASAPLSPSLPAQDGNGASPEDAGTKDKLVPLVIAPRSPIVKADFAEFDEAITVLVVDDDFRNIFALTALLERGNLNVVAAESGVSALEILRRRSDIAAVLMDVMMPIMNGYETMQAIRELPDYATVPILAVTGKAVAGERIRCLEAGASDYIPKPIDTSELLAALGKWLPHSSESPPTRQGP